MPRVLIDLFPEVTTWLLPAWYHPRGASYYAVTGDSDQALDWLEKAYAERDGRLVWLKVHPRLDSIRDEPRFRDLLARMRLE